MLKTKVDGDQGKLQKRIRGQRRRAHVEVTVPTRGNLVAVVIRPLVRRPGPNPMIVRWERQNERSPFAKQFVMEGCVVASLVAATLIRAARDQRWCCVWPAGCGATRFVHRWFFFGNAFPFSPADGVGVGPIARRTENEERTYDCSAGYRWRWWQVLLSKLIVGVRRGLTATLWTGFLLVSSQSDF